MPQNINFNNLLKQDLILLSDLKNIPEIIINKLVEFSNKGGDLVIIPNVDSNLNSYNSFFKKMNIGKLQRKIKDTLKITSINYEHPLFKMFFLNR